MVQYWLEKEEEAEVVIDILPEINDDDKRDCQWLHILINCFMIIFLCLLICGYLDPIPVRQHWNTESVAKMIIFMQDGSRSDW